MKLKETIYYTFCNNWTIMFGLSNKNSRLLLTGTLIIKNTAGKNICSIVLDKTGNSVTLDFEYKKVNVTLSSWYGGLLVKTEPVLQNKLHELFYQVSKVLYKCGGEITYVKTPDKLDDYNGPTFYKPKIRKRF